MLVELGHIVTAVVGRKWVTGNGEKCVSYIKPARKQILTNVIKWIMNYYRYKYLLSNACW